jgi:hypothetical protein
VPGIPGEMLFAALLNGSRKTKEGKLAAASVLVDDAVLVYDGPSDPEELFQDANFRYMRMVRVGASKVPRLRPRFPTGWKLNLQIHYQPDQVDKEKVLTWLRATGQFVGLGDRRPSSPHGGPFGRFEIVE